MLICDECGLEVKGPVIIVRGRCTQDIFHPTCAKCESCGRKVGSDYVMHEVPCVSLCCGKHVRDKLLCSRCSEREATANEEKSGESGRRRLPDLRNSALLPRTSLPVDEEILRERLEKSEKAFRGQLERIEYGKYLLMMEDTSTGEVVGCSAVKAGTGIDHPFFNYRIITLSQASHAAGR